MSIVPDLATNLKEVDIVTARYPSANHKNSETRQSLCITNVLYSIQTSKIALYDKAKCNIPLRFTFVVCYLTILERSKYTASSIPPCTHRFLAYVDASRAQDCTVVFGSQWLQW